MQLDLDLDYHITRRYFQENRQVSDWLIREALTFRQEHGTWGREEIKHCASIQKAVTRAFNAKSTTIEIEETSLSFLDIVLKSWVDYNLAIFAGWWGTLSDEIEAVLSGKGSQTHNRADSTLREREGRPAAALVWSTVVSDAARYDPEATVIYNEVKRVFGTAPESVLLDLAIRKTTQGSLDATITLRKYAELKQEGKFRDAAATPGATSALPPVEAGLEVRVASALDAMLLPREQIAKALHMNEVALKNLIRKDPEFPTHRKLGRAYVYKLPGLKAWAAAKNRVLDLSAIGGWIRTQLPVSVQLDGAELTRLLLQARDEDGHQATAEELVQDARLRHERDPRRHG